MKSFKFKTNKHIKIWTFWFGTTIGACLHLILFCFLNEPSTTRISLMFCYEWFYFFKAGETTKCSAQRRHILLLGKFLFVQNIPRFCTKSPLKNVPLLRDRNRFLAKNAYSTEREKDQKTNEVNVLKYVQLILKWFSK